MTAVRANSIFQANPTKLSFLLWEHDWMGNKTVMHHCTTHTLVVKHHSLVQKTHLAYIMTVHTCQLQLASMHSLKVK